MSSHITFWRGVDMKRKLSGLTILFLVSSLLPLSKLSPTHAEEYALNSDQLRAVCYKNGGPDPNKILFNWQTNSSSEKAACNSTSEFTDAQQIEEWDTTCQQLGGEASNGISSKGLGFLSCSKPGS